MKIIEQAPLSKYTSWHVGGPAAYVAMPTNEAEVREAIAFAQEKQLPWYILGKGSNTLFPDSGFPGVVIIMSDRTVTVSGNEITAGAGTFLRQLINKALDTNLRGLEELAGIPGTVGGAVRGNAGTWHTEVKDVLVSTKVLKISEDGQAEISTMTPADCHFGYRHSIFKEQPQWIILSATFSTTPGDSAEGKKLVAQDLTDRHTKQPYDAPSAGSVFKNPDKANGIFSGKLIQEAGLQGTQIGGAQISPKHANFIVNRGGATSADITKLIALVQRTVKEKFSIELEPEIVIVPEL
jgi:UDP-N-acetylmuramate dehydrogenase